MNVRLITMLAAAIAVAVIAVGCGGGDDSTSTSATGGSNGGASSGSNGATVTTSSLGKDEFIKQASAACEGERKNFVQEASAYMSKHASQGLPEGVLLAGMAKTVLLPAIEAEIASIRALGAPSGDEEQIESILAAQQAAVDEVRALKSVKTLEEVESYFTGATRKLEDYGFTACTNNRDL